MEIKEEFANKMLECDWLGRCGMEDDLGFDVTYVKENKVGKLLGSPKWNKIYYDVRGDFTSYLSINHREADRYWNVTVNMIKEKYISVISVSLERVLCNNPDKDEILAWVQFNIIDMFMIHFYSEYYHDEFYDKTLKIYMAGHFPCGWEGRYPNGNFTVW